MAKKSMDDLLKRRMSAAQQASELEVGNEAYETMFQAKADAASPAFANCQSTVFALFARQTLDFIPTRPKNSAHSLSSLPSRAYMSVLLFVQFQIVSSMRSLPDTIVPKRGD